MVGPEHARDHWDQLIEYGTGFIDLPAHSEHLDHEVARFQGVQVHRAAGASLRLPGLSKDPLGSF